MSTCNHMHIKNWAKSECMHHVFKASRRNESWKDDQLHWHMNIEWYDHLYVHHVVVVVLVVIVVVIVVVVRSSNSYVSSSSTSSLVVVRISNSYVSSSCLLFSCYRKNVLYIKRKKHT